MNTHHTGRWLGIAAGIALFVLLVTTTPRIRPDPVRPPEYGSADAVPKPAVAADATDGEESPDAPPADRTIRVEVTAGSFDPVDGATVTAHDRSGLVSAAPWLEGETGEFVDVRPPGKILARGVTDGEGRLVLRLPRPGTFAVRASKEGVGDATRLARTGSGCDLQLQGTSLRGFRLVDRDDRPVAGGVVTVHPWEISCPPRGRGTSGADGRLRLAVGEDDALFVRADGYATVWEETPLELADGTIVLEPAWPVAGTVTDAEGRPVEGAAVRLGCHGWQLAVTGEDGTFSFDDVPALTPISDNERNLVELRFDHPDFLSTERVVSPGTADVGTVLYRHGRAQLRVRLVPPENAAEERFSFGARHASGLQLTAVQEPRGIFTVSNVPAGPVTLSAAGLKAHQRRRYEVCRGRARIEVRPGESVREVTIRMEPMTYSFVAVRILDPEGRPCKDAEIWTDEHGLCFSKAYPDGTAWIRLLVKPGTLVPLDVSQDEAHGKYCATRIVVKTTADIPDPAPVVTLRPGPVLTVRAVDSAGNPIPPSPSSFLILQKKNAVGSQESGNHATLDPSTPHTARMRIHPDRGFGIVARVEGHGVFCRRYPAPGPKDTSVTVRMPPEAGLRGRLVTATGRAYRDAYITATMLDDAAAPQFGGASERVDADGRFAISGLVRGRVRISAFDSDRPLRNPIAERVLVLAGSGETDVGDLLVGRLPRIRGVVKDQDGNPLSGTVVVCRPTRGGRLLTRTLTRPDGTFELATPIRPDHELAFIRDGWERRELPLADRHYMITLPRER